MARRQYSEADKARIFAELEVHEGNVKRTARHLNLPISTVRYFKQHWEKEGLPKEVAEALPDVVTEFLGDAERVRDKLLVALEEKVDSRDITARDTITALGVLTDKIRAMRGLDAKKVEHSISLPDADEMRALFQGVINEVVGAAQTRNDELEAADIVEGDWEPSPARSSEPANALPAPKHGG